MFEYDAHLDAEVYRNATSDRALLVIDDIRAKSQLEELIHTYEDSGIPNLVFVTVDNWNKDLTPFDLSEMEGLHKLAKKFTGGGEVFFKERVAPLIHAIREHLQVSHVDYMGYSLAGLFGLFAEIQGAGFEHLFLGSPSVWYPKFVECLRKHDTPKVNLTIAFGKHEGDEHPLFGEMTHAVHDIQRQFEEAGQPVRVMSDTESHFKGHESRLDKLMQVYLDNINS